MQTAIYQAIETKHVSPTNFRGARIKATCQRGSKVLEWDDALNAEQNHIAAAEALCVKFAKEDAKTDPISALSRWIRPMVCGVLKGSYVHVFTGEAK